MTYFFPMEEMDLPASTPDRSNEIRSVGTHDPGGPTIMVKPEAVHALLCNAGHILALGLGTIESGVPCSGGCLLYPTGAARLREQHEQSHAAGE